MKNTLLFFLLSVSVCFPGYKAFGQAGGVFTVAGGGTSTADGVPATNASLLSTTGVAIDGAGNIFFADKMRYIIRRIDAVTGLIYTIAGTPGTPGFAGDGGPATSAILSSNIGGIQVSSAGDIYFSDHDRVRKISATTGNITTVAGGGTSIADGVPATNASLLIMDNMYVSNAGDVYVNSNHRIKKVDATTGIITTVAGGGTSDADGIPAVDARMPDTAKSISMDNAGNLYILFGNVSADKIRKIDAASGLIFTVAGGGSSLSEGVPATNMLLNNTRASCVDGDGNIFIPDWSRHLVRRVDASTGLVNTIAGSTSAGDTAEGTSALSALVKPYILCLNTATGTVYYSDLSTRVKRFSYSPMALLSGGSTTGIYSSDSLFVSFNKKCSGPQVTVRTRSFHSGMTIRTYFGDGTGDTTNVGASWSDIGGYIFTSVVYPTSGTYTVTHVLCNYGVAVDTLSYVYNHTFCSQMSVYYYNDADLNCVKDNSEHFAMKSIITQIDSNGVPVDTIVATSGFTYMAYGNPGDIYRFKILSTPVGMIPSCPSTGYFYDTLVSGITENTARFAAFSCVASATADLSVSAHVPVTGPNDQWGHIYVRNNGCIPTDASVTLHFSPKYRYTGGARPVPTSYTETSITWSLANLSSTDGVPQDIYFVVWHNMAFPYPVDGDTVNEMIIVTPVGGVTDVNTANNMVIRTDTVRTSCDPNEIVVSPSCFDNDTTFHFTVHFENIGSAPAENIYVMDTLSPWFDASTIDIEMSTHTMFTSKQVANGLTIYRFDFPNINLADSSDHANRDGAFMYTIKNKTGMPTGVIARSRVGIYFDYNDVLLTNTVDNRKGCPTTGIAAVGTKGNDIAIYPNPTGGTLTIDMGNNSYSTLSVTNAIGQQLLQQAVANPQQTIDVCHLPAGIYYVALRGSMGTEVRKFVKW